MAVVSWVLLVASILSVLVGFGLAGWGIVSVEVGQRRKGNGYLRSDDFRCEMGRVARGMVFMAVSVVLAIICACAMLL